MLPRELLESAAWATISFSGCRALVALAAQYHGANNGRLTLPFSVASTLGISSKGALIRGLHEIEARGLIECTYQGGLPPLGSSRFALTWRRIDADESLGVAARPASNKWATWTDTFLVERRRKRGKKLRSTGDDCCDEHGTTPSLTMGPRLPSQ